jgi:chromosome segregation ATPase
LKELTRTIAGYKRTITDFEKRIAEAESRQQCTRRHVGDEEDDYPTLLERANAKEQLSAYESELAMLRRRDSERESELSRLRDLVRSISNGSVAEGVSLQCSPKVYGIDLLKALNEYLDEERARKDGLELENRELRDQLRRGPIMATGDGPEDIPALKQEIEELRKESVAQTQVLSARNREREQLYAELEELKLQHIRNGREPNTTMNGDSGHEECEATINELRDRLTEMRMQNQDQRDELDGAFRDLEQIGQDKLDAQEDYQVEIDRLQEVIDQLVKECDELREAKEDTERVADELDQEIESLVKEAQDKMAYQEREIRVRDEHLVAIKTDMQETLNKAYLDIESLEETVMNKNARIENLRDELQDIEEEHAKLIQKYEEIIQQGSRLQVQQEVSARELQFLREEADNSALKVADFQNLERKLLDAERKVSRETARAKELQAKIDVLESDMGKAGGVAEEKLKKQVEELTAVRHYKIQS